MRKSFIIACFALSIFSCGTSQQQTPNTETIAVIDPTVYGNTITSNELKELLYTYASDEFEGRDTGSKGQKMAVEFLKQHYVALGIPSPISKDDYFQEVPLLSQKSPETDISVNGVAFQNYTDLVTVGGASSNPWTCIGSCW